MSRGTFGGVAAILAASLLWGTTGTAATFAPHVGPLAIGAAALGVGGILQAAIAIPALRRERPYLRANRTTIWTGAVSVMVYPLAFYYSMHLAGVAIGTVISLASAPLTSGVLECVMERRSLSRRWMLAAALGIAGSIALCLSKVHQAPSSAASTLGGIALGIVAGVTYALYSWCVHRLMNHGIGRAAAMGAVFGTGGTLLLPVLIVSGGPLFASTQAFTVAAYMALVPMFLGYLLFGYGLTHVPPSTATTLTLSEPAVAAILAVLIVGERLPPTGWAGLATIGLALVVLAIAPGTSGDHAARAPAITGSPLPRHHAADEPSRRW